MEEKIRFYSQYLFQDVLITPRLIWSGNPPEPSHEEWVEDTLTLDNINKVCEHNYPLFLRSLAEITDEDKLWIIRNIHYNHVKFSNPRPIELWQDDFIYDSWTADYLRSKGYAVNWNGISIEEQTERGWVAKEK